MKLADY